MKKKIFLIALAACLITLSIAGTSLAYFTDTDAKTNVFTAGNVDITLTYNKAADATTGNFYPGQEYTGVNASIANTGSENAYIGAIIKLARTDTGVNANAEGNESVNISDIFAPTKDDEDNIPAAIKDVFVGLEGTGRTVKYVATTDGYTIYVIVEASVAKDGTADIFTKLDIPDEWDNAQMKVFNGLTVTVTAYATQTVGFANATKALTTAFSATKHWGGYPATTTAETEAENVEANG